MPLAQVTSPEPATWPALVVSLVVGFYWARVVKMAWKARASHRGHLLPPEDIGRKLRLLWGPVVALWVALPLLMWLRWGPPIIHAPLIASPAPRIAGAIIVIACLICTWHCWKLMGRHWRMGIDPTEANALLTSGPWGYVRHPIYSLSILMAIGTWLAAPSGVLCAVIATHICFILWEAVREEGHLQKVHGDAYRHYQQRTGMLLPIFRRSPAKSGDVI